MNNKGGTSVGEIIFILCMFLPMVLMAVLQMWPLFYVFLAFNLIFGLTEVLYVKFTGKTVSQQFWAYAEKSKVKAIAILASMALMWTALIIHLGMKMFK
jgi:hypothetical protein